MRKTIKENKKEWPMQDLSSNLDYSIKQWLDKLDTKACEVESRWGVGRLENLVSFETNQKWLRQTEKLNRAISESDLFTIPDLVNGTIRGYDMLEAEAIKLGNKPHDAPLAWTVDMRNGKTLAIVRHNKDAALLDDLRRDKQDVVVWTLDEIVNVIENRYMLEDKVKGKTVEPLKAEPFDFEKGDKIEF